MIRREKTHRKPNHEPAYVTIAWRFRSQFVDDNRYRMPSRYFYPEDEE